MQANALKAVHMCGGDLDALRNSLSSTMRAEIVALLPHVTLEASSMCCLVCALCALAVCNGSPVAANGTFSCGTSSAFGSTCTATCNTGFSGFPSATCGSAGWSTVSGSCTPIGEWQRVVVVVHGGKCVGWGWCRCVCVRMGSTCTQHSLL